MTTFNKNHIPISGISDSVRDFFSKVSMTKNISKLNKLSLLQKDNYAKIEDLSNKRLELLKLFPPATEGFNEGYKKGFDEGMKKGIEKGKSGIVPEKERKGLLSKLGEFFTNRNQSNKKESGGPVQSGQEYLVGETGPELFVPNTSGQIITNTNLKSITEDRNINQLNKDMDKKVVYVPIIRNNKHTTIVNRRVSR